MNVTKIGNCHFMQTNLQGKMVDLASRLESGEKVNIPDTVVVRADNGANIYILAKWLFESMFQHLKENRKAITGATMAMPITAFHKNVIEDQVYWSFGNIFGANSLLIGEKELQGNIPEAGQKLKNVTLRIGKDTCFIERWETRLD